MLADEIVSRVRNHRCYSHPVFEHWASRAPAPDAIGALFHQIRKFCDATRPGHNLPTGLREHGLAQGSQLLQEIVESEEDHGPHLAAMAGHIINRAAGAPVCPDVFDQAAVESKLKVCSDLILGQLPGYEVATGLMPQTRKAIAVFDHRKNTDLDSIYRSLGTTLALEMISNRHLIPGEKHCLVDSGLYDVSLEEPEMEYLVEHWGETGAEAQHEKNAIDAISSVLTPKNKAVMLAGVDDFLNSLTALWDLLDAALLGSGVDQRVRAAESLAVTG
jgi:hypothetical protein